MVNNKNLNMSTSLNAKQIDTFQNLHNLALKVKIREGLLDINETTISWLNIADIKTFIGTQKEIIIQYRDYYEGEEDDEKQK